MHPIWSASEQRFDGVVGVDIALDQVASLVRDVKRLRRCRGPLRG